MGVSSPSASPPSTHRETLRDSKLVLRGRFGYCQQFGVLTRRENFLPFNSNPSSSWWHDLSAGSPLSLNQAVGSAKVPVRRKAVRCSCPRKAGCLPPSRLTYFSRALVMLLLSPLYPGGVPDVLLYLFLPNFEPFLKWPLFSTVPCESVILKWARVTLPSESPLGPNALGIKPTGHANQTWLHCQFLITPFLRDSASAHVFILISFGFW